LPTVEHWTFGQLDAAVVLDRVQPVDTYVTGPHWVRSLETISGRKLVGVATKYR
jgi:hypothetical protein